MIVCAFPLYAVYHRFTPRKWWTNWWTQWWTHFIGISNECRIDEPMETMYTIGI